MDKKINNVNFGAITQKTYDCVAKSFAKSRIKKDKIIELFFKYHQPQGKVLDLGCGSGRTLKYLKQQNFFKNPKNNYLGIDYSNELLKITKTNSTSILRSREVAQVKFRKQNLLNLKLKQNFDYVLALASLHHLEPKNHLIVLQKIKKLLKTKGEFAGYVWSPNKIQILKWTKISNKQYLKPWNGDNGPKMYIYLFQKKELEKMLKTAGFKKIKVEFAGKGIKKNLFFKAKK